MSNLDHLEQWFLTLAFRELVTSISRNYETVSVQLYLISKCAARTKISIGLLSYSGGSQYIILVTVFMNIIFLY